MLTLVRGELPSKVDVGLATDFSPLLSNQLVSLAGRKHFNGPDDLASALEWSAEVSRNSSFLVSLRRTVVVPQPGTSVSFGAALLTVAFLARWRARVRSFARTATQEVELRGKTIAKGQKVLMVYPSANRDEEVFDAPDELRIDRKPQHLAFGIGAHFCLGANLARMELRVALGELLRRLPDMEYSDGGPMIVPHSLVRACVHMRVRYTPEAAA